ncbi:pre-rRNA-processing protein PNO1 [Rozella allomycis CSF55]|nr:pre-rRNA-processing protein PNO1 [Rozella allomycis CSF55]
MQVDGPMFPALSAKEMQAVDVEYRKIPVPHNRITPLRQNWLKIYEPLVDYMKLQVRMNVKRRCVELRTSEDSTENSSLQKGADFVRAFTLGFDVDDAIALLRLDELYIDSFEIRDVKSLTGDHMSRAIGRVAGKSGKTKFAIENATRTRIVVADSKIHILGSYQNTILAKRAIVSLILGSPPGKVYGNLKNVATRMKQSL